MTNNKDWLSEYKEIDQDKVVMGDSHNCQVKGIETVSFKMFDGVIKHLKNVMLEHFVWITIIIDNSLSMLMDNFVI